MVKRKKKKKKAEKAAEKIPVTETPKRKRPVKRGGFYWGLGLGFTFTLLAVVAGDLGWGVVPTWTQPPAVAVATPGAAGVSSDYLFLDRVLPEGAHVYVDGKPAEVIEQEGGVAVPVSAASTRLEIRGATDTWWSTHLPSPESRADTLRPAWGGEIVVEVQRQGPQGKLFLDGVEMGSAPGSLSEIDPGWHALSIRDGDHILFEDGCTVTSGEVTVVTVPPVPPRGQGRMVVRSRILSENGFEETEGNQVIVDGVLRGVTPLDLNLAAGFHSVRIEAERRPPRIEALYLEAGTTRYVDGEFGREQRLFVRVNPPLQADTQRPLAIPVEVIAEGETVLLEKGSLQVVRPGQATPVSVPLVPSGTDAKLWVGVLPLELISSVDEVVGYATCVDDLGREGDSELFRIGLTE